MGHGFSQIEKGRFAVDYMNHISKVQGQFLREVRDGSRTLGELKERFGIDGHRFALWRRNKFFRVLLRRALRESDAQLLVEARCMKKAASGILSDAIKHARRVIDQRRFGRDQEAIEPESLLTFRDLKLATDAIAAGLKITARKGG